jgi:ketosteroid isomerase-like protein
VVAEVLAKIPEAWEDFEIRIDRLLTDGDRVVMHGRHRATRARATRARATGRPLNAHVAHVWDFKDGKVIR